MRLVDTGGARGGKSTRATIYIGEEITYGLASEQGETLNGRLIRVRRAGASGSTRTRGRASNGGGGEAIDRN
jgi:hypothetical protein